MLPPVKRKPAIIFSHSLGNLSSGWSFLAKQLGIPLIGWSIKGIDFEPHIHLPTQLHWMHLLSSFPDAPVQPVTLNMGAMMPLWFGILGLRPDALEDKKGLLESVKTIKFLVEKQVKAGIPSERIVVGVFHKVFCHKFTIPYFFFKKNPQLICLAQILASLWGIPGSRF
ncbi:hypothetical protein PTTG_02113 [Puccinia triticina 1-1 BBBD Race 1]|uniref:Acyl-protein thioesterase 1 n=1 Tax=Puccinia triticina (isolate 1-1 / race 1 (BBBD)) TaxID=630390 RepID=A0A0C4EMX3_PUCT1|nr:hypothetical protein PTTG_02113 [Puccinia triticina 1-1 BBBD Race 1]